MNEYQIKEEIRRTMDLGKDRLEKVCEISCQIGKEKVLDRTTYMSQFDMLEKEIQNIFENIDILTESEEDGIKLLQETLGKAKQRVDELDGVIDKHFNIWRKIVNKKREEQKKRLV